MREQHNLKDLLEYVTTNEPPPEAGPARVFERARSIRRRRSATIAVAGVAAVGAVVAGVAVAGPFGARPQRAPAVASSGAPSTGTPRAPMPPAAVLGTLRALLPAEIRSGDPRSEPGFARVVVTDDAGRSTVEVNVQPDFAGGTGKVDGGALLDRYDCAKRSDPAGTRCTADVLADQTRVVSVEGPAGEPGATEVIRRQVDTLTADGLRVVVTVWNAVDVHQGPVTRSAPALDDERLRDIATSPRWSTAGGAAAPDGGARN